MAEKVKVRKKDTLGDRANTLVRKALKLPRQEEGQSFKDFSKSTRQDVYKLLKKRKAVVQSIRDSAKARKKK